MWEAIGSAAVIAYARCFSGGKRYSLPKSTLLKAPSELRDFHGYVLDVRDKHIAHSVNVFEENRLIVDIEFNGGHAERIANVHVEPSRMIGISDPDIAIFYSLTDWLLSHIGELYEVERILVLRYLEAQPIDDIAMRRIEPLPECFKPMAHAKVRSRE